MHHEYVSYPGYSHFPMVIDRLDMPVRVYEKGASIAQKRDEIVSQLAHIRNTQQARGASTYSVDNLSAAFEKSFGKATSGYWRGGLRDPFWRCLLVPDSPGFICSMVADQLDEACEERLTPSAKRFLKILTCLSEALALHREMLRGRESLLAQSDRLGNRALDDVNADWGMLDDRKRKHMVFRAETALFVEQMRCAVDEARSNVRQEKKHHGKREAINGGLYTIAAVVSGIALIVSTWVVAIIGFCIAMVIRCVSLGSIRGFDREKGWKAVESLLDQTKDFINREENAMHLSLNTVISLEQANQDRLVWQQLQKTLHTVNRNSEQGEKTWGAVCALQQAVASDQGRKTWDAVCELQQAVAAGTAETSSIKQELQRTSTSLRDDIAKLRNMILFDTSSRQSSTPEGRPASCGPESVTPRVPMERATSLDTFRPSSISPQLRA
ncbi:hypothetical protein PAN31117_02729 [Pandoraea anapnoica]|uniref:Transmembrane protein n=1 Tax=Pandoraea anapnoica TaxID=2508301 RepID=A0A5E5A3P5_9BURK|nr:hypothetical protein [Pandoraea anapnoica]VVE67738.1 hypothetical protein PAN31117_02729 [Pandoraea anapnoica]